jgi:hypothetical protein
VLFVVDGAEIGRDTIPSIPAGGTGTASVLWGSVKHLQGLHTVVVTADPTTRSRRQTRPTTRHRARWRW